MSGPPPDPPAAPPPEPRPPRPVRLPGFLVEEDVGLGDALKKATTRIGIRPCGGCARRAAALNRRVVLTRRRPPSGPAA